MATSLPAAASTGAASALASSAAGESARARATPAAFHIGSNNSGGASLFFTCQQCHKQSALDGDAPIHAATLEAFNAAFPSQHVGKMAPGTSSGAVGAMGPPAGELLSESFVVLPPGKPASQFAPPSSTPPAPSLTQRIISSVSGAPSAAAPASSSAAAASAAVPVTQTDLQARSEAASRVFDIVTAQCGVQQPLCTHCSHTVFSELDRKLADSERDKEEYQRFLAGVLIAGQQQPPPTNEEEEAAEEAELTRQEAELEEQLSALRREKQALHLEADSLESEATRLAELEAAFWREYEEYSLAQQHVVSEQAHVSDQIKAASEALERLSRTNVFDDAFHISHDGHFATINGFRLGRLPSQPVEWAEISAALGQALLLLATMARQTDYVFQKYRLIPMGSYSKLCRVDDPQSLYELYGSNDLILGRLFWYRRFDQALVWLLACIQEFAEFAHSKDNAFTLKYPIRGDLIGGQSIKLQFNNDRAWSKALKYMLINLKFMLGWTARRMATKQ